MCGSLRTVEIASPSVSTCRAPSFRVSVASGTVRKSKSISSFFTAFLVYLKSGSTELRAPMSTLAKQRRSLQSPICPDVWDGRANVHPLEEALERCASVVALGLGNAWTKTRHRCRYRQGKKWKRGGCKKLRTFPTNITHVSQARATGSTATLAPSHMSAAEEATSLTDITLSLRDSSRTCCETFPSTSTSTFQTLTRLTDTAILNFSRETNQAKCSPTPPTLARSPVFCCEPRTISVHPL